MNQQDEEVMATVLANPVTAKMFVQELEKRGVVIHNKHGDLSHEQNVEIVLSVWTELSRRELNS